MQASDRKNLLKEDVQSVSALENNLKTDQRRNLQWFKKAKWTVKKILLKPPQNTREMKNLCETLVKRQYGEASASSAIISTALSLWEDPNLVAALQRNQTFLNAKERIERTAFHLLPEHSQLLDSKQEIPQHQVLICDVCGRNLHCSHNHTPNNCDTQTATGRLFNETSDSLIRMSDDELADEFLKSTTVVGTIGKTPEALEAERAAARIEMFKQKMDVSQWFGPLVLASLAIFGLAVGIFTGDITFSHLKSLGARSFAAISIVIRASNNIFSFLGR